MAWKFIWDILRDFQTLWLWTNDLLKSLKKLLFYTFVPAIMLLWSHLYPFLAFPWHLLSITLHTKKVTIFDGTPLRLEMENEVMSKRSTPNIYNLWLFYNFSKLCKKGGVRYSMHYESLFWMYHFEWCAGWCRLHSDAVDMQHPWLSWGERWSAAIFDFHKFTLLTGWTLLKDRLVAPPIPLTAHFSTNWQNILLFYLFHMYVCILWKMLKTR